MEESEIQKDVRIYSRGYGAGRITGNTISSLGLKCYEVELDIKKKFNFWWQSNPWFPVGNLKKCKVIKP